jgi:acetyl-CoA carboxylase carboxyltransferase component
MIIRNAFGGAYAAFNSYFVGADLVLALPTTRVAVMGPAGKEYVYKADLRKVRDAAKARAADGAQQRVAAGADADEARREAEREAAEWLKTQEAEFNLRYERELMNPREALSLGSISEIVMPAELRSVLVRNLEFMLRRYQPGPWQTIQREFH